MIQEITVALSALKAATEIVKGISSLKTEVEIKSKTSELLGNIIDLQGAMLALQAHVSDLQEENAKLKQQIAKESTDAVFINHGVEFRKGKITGGKWLPFCPKCHLPVAHNPFSPIRRPFCTDETDCGWTASEECHSIESWITEIP